MDAIELITKIKGSEKWYIFGNLLDAISDTSFADLCFGKDNISKLKYPFKKVEKYAYFDTYNKIQTTLLNRKDSTVYKVMANLRIYLLRSDKLDIKVQTQYIDYFEAKYPECRFYGSETYMAAIVVKSIEDKIVGYITADAPITPIKESDDIKKETVKLQIPADKYQTILSKASKRKESVQEWILWAIDNGLRSHTKKPE